MQPYVNRKSYLMGVGGNWYGKKISMQMQRKIADEDFSDQATTVIKLGMDRWPACEERDKECGIQMASRHSLPKKSFENSWIKPPDPKFVSSPNLRHVTSLRHRLEDPIRQPTGSHQLQPQRMRLMTKESFQCPGVRCSNAFLMKPAIGARHCSFEVKKLALDYLPHMRMYGPLTGWPTVKSKDLNEACKYPMTLLLYFANSLSKPVNLQIKPLSSDEFSNAKVTCTRDLFTIAKLDSNVRNIWDPLRFHKKKLGSKDFTADHVLGLVLNVTPKSLHQDKFEFVLSVKLMAEILCGDGEYQEEVLSYPVEITVRRPQPETRRSSQRRKTQSNIGSRHSRRQISCSGQVASAKN